jgi:FAD-dependent urate hydroxylase
LEFIGRNINPSDLPDGLIGHRAVGSPVMERKRMSIIQLSRRVRRELTYLGYPDRDWTFPHSRDGVRVLDVLIVGGGQSGLATSFGLKLERITNIRIIDRNPRGLEGPWRRFARMRELRTPKEVDGIDFGIPSLTARAWYEANFGRKAWDNIQSLPQDRWRSYLDWFRETLDLSVENEVELTSIEPFGDLLSASLRHPDRVERVLARKIVLATGFDGSGHPRLPRSLVSNLPPRCAFSRSHRLPSPEGKARRCLGGWGFRLR